MREFFNTYKTTIISVAVIAAIFVAAAIVALTFNEITPVGYLRFR